ncbi:glucose-6-phosphate isomerase [Lysinibacillus antri]|uniref:Glucose-6-phosphate isomerase n=1 Tax=Lysinibacillus antri TaxID=2498145 RepID=A0A3S0RX04_9BACI|nr:glucose-6-phosphate isomerase [Lysinibacillus antri]RUL55166.1 glucose-6-phosphate isomerase [Lysinibacillus antri]
MGSRLHQSVYLAAPSIDIDWSKYATNVSTIHHHLKKIQDHYAGWINFPPQNYEDVLTSIQRLAEEIKSNAEVLVVIGVGGSFLGAKAIQEALSPYFGVLKNGVQVVYAGQNLSGAYIQHLLNSIGDKEIYLNIISKSGTTMEPSLAFRVFRQYMEQRYGSKSKQRIIVTTDGKKGVLKEIAEYAGYRQFVIPSNIGGRYSVFTPVGLIPIAAAGIDIFQFIEGAKDAAVLLNVDNIERNDAYRYAVIRNELYKRGYYVELLASFEPSLALFHEWWKQLFGESEGKNKKGIFPSAVTYSTDLHSIGQYIQEGSPILFETFLHFKEIQDDYPIPFDSRNDDLLNELSTYSFNGINRIAKEGSILAHVEGGVPVIQLELKKLDAHHMGYLMYFFMKACVMSSFLLDVNPFNQPGVDIYKNKMNALLKRR